MSRLGRGPAAVAGRALRGDARGSIYVEFLIAFLPFFIFFLCLWQLSILFYGQLMVDHAAFAAARAAAVVVAECPDVVGDTGPATVNHLTDQRKTRIEAAAYIALAPLILDGTIGVSTDQPFVTYPTTPLALSGTQVAYAPMTNSLSNIRVRVNATLICKIAIANEIECGSFLALLPHEKSLHGEAVFPFQGASYTYQPGCQ
jgi:hypothetical protein